MTTMAIAHKDEEIINLASSNPGNRTYSVSPSRLPTETLEAIFINCACDYYSEDNGYPIPTAPSWVNASYVCRQWRNVALNCATLWTYLFIVSPRRTEELLARSKQSSLKLQVNPNRDDKRSWGLCFVEEVMNHVERIQELRLKFPLAYSRAGYLYLSKLSSRRAPRLQYLEMAPEGAPSNWSSALFNGDTPSLRTLDITDCSMPWYSFKPNCLTTLSLCAVPAMFRQKTVDFLATLNCMQDLTHLYLDDALASAASFLSSATFNTFQKFSLLRLSRLLIAAPLSTIVALFSCVNIPSQTEVRLECYVEPSSTFCDYVLISSLLTQRLAMSEGQALPGMKIRLLVIEFTGWDMAKLTFSASERNHDSFGCLSRLDWGCNIPLRVVLRYRLSPKSNRDRMIIRLRRSIPFPNIQSIHVLNPPFRPTSWILVLGCLQGLR